MMYKYLKPEAIVGAYTIKHNIRVFNMPNFKHDLKYANHQLSEYMEEITL